MSIVCCGKAAMLLCDICTDLYVDETDLVPGGLLQLYIEIKVLLG